MRSLLLALASMILTAATALAAEPPLTVYCEYPTPKKVVIGSKGGVIYDQVRRLMERTGLGLPVQQVTWKRGYTEATTRANVALYPTTRTPQREDLFHWVGPILRVEWSFYAHADSGITVNSLEDARKVGAIGTYLQDSKEQWLKARGFTNLVSVMDNQTNLKKLYEKRIDLMVGTPTVTDRWPETYGLDPDKLVHVYTFKSAHLYLAISKGTPEDIAHRLQKEFQTMIEDGTIREIYTKWIPDSALPFE